VENPVPLKRRARPTSSNPHTLDEKKLRTELVRLRTGGIRLSVCVFFLDPRWVFRR